MTMIPIDIDSIPTGMMPLDESLTYRVILRSIALAPKVDKNNDKYYKVDCEVADGEFKGRHIFDNYVRYPATQEKGKRFAQLVRCFKVPYTRAGITIEDGIGREGNVTIRNENFPEGSSNIVSRVNVYLESQ